MSGTNSNILLGFDPTKQIGPDFTKGIENSQRLLEIRKQQQQADQQNALLGVFKDPNSLDGTGQPTPDAMKKIWAIDPNIGMQIQQNNLINQDKKLQQQANTSDLRMKQMNMINEGMAPIMESYDAAIAAGTPEPQARRDAQAAMGQTIDRFKTSGIFTEDDYKRFPTTFDPDQMRNVIAGTKQHQEYVKNQRADADQKRKDEEEGRKQKHDDEVNFNKNTTEEVDNEKLPYTHRPNAPPGKQNVYEDGSPVPPEKRVGATKMGGPGSAATQEHNDRAFVVQNAYEKELGHPVGTDDEKAELKSRVLADVANAKTEAVKAAAQARADALAKPKDMLVDGKPTQLLWKGSHYVNIDGSPVKGDIRTAGKPPTPAAAIEADAMAVADSQIAAAEAKAGRPLSAEERAKIRQTARSDPKVQEALAKNDGKAIDDDAACLIAEETIAGDWHATVGLGRNEASMRKIVNCRGQIAKERGLSGADLAVNTAEFNGVMAAERTLGVRGAGIDVGIAEATKFGPMVLEASKNVDRSKYTSVNALQLAAEQGTGGENVVRLVDAMNAYKMAYTQILTRGGMPTDDARRRSDEVINAAWSNNQVATAIDQLGKEMEGARSAIPQVRDNLYFTVTGRKRTSPVEPITQTPTNKSAWKGPVPDAAQNDLKTRTAAAQTPEAAAQERAHFDEHFGPGAADKILGPGWAGGVNDPSSAAYREATARAAETKPAVSAKPMPLPKNPKAEDLVNDQVYDTGPRGLGKWDSKQQKFIPVRGP